MVQKGNLAVFESSNNYLQNQYSHAHQNWCACMWHQLLLAWSFWANSKRLNFLMTMDYSPRSKREIWAFLKLVISRNWRVHTHHNWCACIWHLSLLQEIFEPILINDNFSLPYTVRQGILAKKYNLKANLFLKLERLHLP